MTDRNPETAPALAKIENIEAQLKTRLESKCDSKIVCLRAEYVAQAKINDIVSETVTGKPWAEFIETVKGGYTPTVSADWHGPELATRFEYMFYQAFGRLAHVQFSKPSLIGAE